VSKQWTPRRQTVELSPAAEQRPSRIRREPPPAAPQPKALNAYPTEREMWTVVIGVVLFAIAITIIVFGVSEYTV
jgi:hypothetical protein